MNSSFIVVLIEALILASSVSLDAFVACIAYGNNKIKIPFSSAMVINIVCSLILGLSFVLGGFLSYFLPEDVGSYICFVILFGIGMSKLLDNFTRSFIRRHQNISKDIHFSFMNFKFVLSVYADPEKADVDESKSISLVESISLAVALSLDGMAVGVGAALGNVNGYAAVFWSLITDLIAILSGVYVGEKLAQHIHMNISWISGAVLVIMAFTKIL